MTKQTVEEIARELEQLLPMIVCSLCTGFDKEDRKQCADMLATHVHRMVVEGVVDELRNHLLLAIKHNVAHKEKFLIKRIAQLKKEIQTKGEENEM